MRTYTKSRRNDERREKWKGERRARLQAVADALGKLSDEQREKIVKALGDLVTIDGHRLSPHNMIYSYVQRKGAPLSVVGGFAQWRDAGRMVKKGEKGFYIAYPSRYAKKDENGAERVDPLTGEKIMGLAFGWACVFDISQTMPAAEAIDPAAGVPLLPEHETIDIR